LFKWVLKDTAWTWSKDLNVKMAVFWQGDGARTPQKLVFFKVWRKTGVILFIYLFTVFYTSFPEILFILHSYGSCRRRRRLWGKPGSNPRLLRDRLVSASGLNH
jgi:hypothetical protein